jgi:predicted transposase YbfD/YdcC
MDDPRTTIEAHFSQITEPREANKSHKLLDIITIVLCATICGCDGWFQIEEFAKAKKEWFETFLELPHGIPSDDTFARVFAAIDPDEFQKAFIDWVNDIQAMTRGEIVAIDGKTLRGSHDQNAGKKSIHMVTAWARENHMVLGQVKTQAKSNEISAIPKLVDLLDIQGCIVTIDAMGCQKNIAAKIVDQGADYVLALKGNQGRLHEDIHLFFQDKIASDLKYAQHECWQTVDGDHGRIETRRYWTTSDLDWLPEVKTWKGLKTAVMVQRTREVKDKVTTETVYYISSLTNDPALMATAIRGHWGIENSLHWVLDVSFREDDSRVRKDNAPQNLAIIRHMALNMLKREKSKRMSIKTKRLKAGWDTRFLEKVLLA